jgi:hypothetical protein
MTPDVQGATAILPAFQLSLLCGLCAAFLGKRAIPFLAILIPVGAALQAATLMMVRELAGRLGAETPVTAVRAVSLLTPALLALTAVALDRRRALNRPDRSASARGISGELRRDPAIAASGREGEPDRPDRSASARGISGELQRDPAIAASGREGEPDRPDRRSSTYKVQRSKFVDLRP